DGARPDPPPRRGLSPSGLPAHDRRQRRSKPSGGCGTRRVHGEEGVNRPPLDRPLFERLALIGVGLIGSSIARAARAQGAVASIVATARPTATRKRVVELGIADQVAETNAAAVEGADLVIVCIPVGACGGVAKEIGPHLAPGAIVSDVGSVKASVLNAM